MGLKSFIVSSVTSKVIEKVSESGKIEEIANKTINKISEITGMETSSNYQPKRNNYLLIKTRSLSISSLTKLSKGVLPDVGESWGKHQVFDKYGNLKYSTELKDTSLIADIINYDKDTLYIFDTNGKEIASLKEKLFTFAIPLLEKNAKRCVVQLNKKDLFDISKSDFLNSTSYSVECSDYSISNSEKIHIKKGNKVIAEIHDFAPTFKDDYIDNFIIEFDDEKEELPILLLGLAIDLLGK